MNNTLFGRDIISIKDLSTDDINLILDTAQTIKHTSKPELLRGKVLASCFFEPSTRTRLSFEAAAHKLGAGVIGFSDDKNTSAKKGETLSDAIRVIGSYADAIVLRHFSDGAARLAADICQVPVINGGDGKNQHPSQTLLDLFSIRECQDSMEGLNIAFVGDLKYGRTSHSLTQALCHFKTRFFFVSPENLMMPENVCDRIKQSRNKFSCHRDINEVIKDVDILYMTRIQKERFDEAEFRAIRNQYVLHGDMLKSVKKNMKVLHPLPRVNEIDVSVDTTPNAYYFQQAENGVYVRQALLALLLNKSLT